jgi:hypothetical protein
MTDRAASFDGVTSSLVERGVGRGDFGAFCCPARGGVSRHQRHAVGVRGDGDRGQHSSRDGLLDQWLDDQTVDLGRVQPQRDNMRAVLLTVKNIGNSARTYAAADQKLIDSGGREFFRRYRGADQEL